MSEFVRTCGIGQPGHVCGLRAIGMVAVQSFRNVFIEVPLTPGIVYLCARHYYDPILEPNASQMSSEAPSSPAETTGADSGTTSYMGVIRGADEADRAATIADLWDVITANGATNSRLMRERDEALATIAKASALTWEWRLKFPVVGTHWEGCHMVHVDCFNIRLRQTLDPTP